MPNNTFTKAREELLNLVPKHAICAEIGVWKGEFTEHIIRVTEPKTIHLIDPWLFQEEFPGRMYGGSVAQNQQDMTEIHQLVVDKFGRHPAAEFNQGKSKDVLSTFPDNYFDWVYIDGNHYYDFVREDLEISKVKVRDGGLITGDDYRWGKAEGLPVKSAVEDFCKTHNLSNKLNIIDNQYLIQI